jgi:hypothetical protein
MSDCQEVAVASSSTGSSGLLSREVTALTGQATLRVDKDAIPHLRKVFDDAMAKLDVQIVLAMSDIRVSPWAGDPVSQNAATDLNDQSVDGADSAFSCRW